MTQVSVRRGLILASALSVTATLQAIWNAQWQMALLVFGAAVVGLLAVLLYCAYRRPANEPLQPQAIPVPIILARDRR